LDPFITLRILMHGALRSCWSKCNTSLSTHWIYW